MKKPSLFSAVTIVQSWVKAKPRIFDSSAKRTKKTKDFIKDRTCLLVKIPYVNLLIRSPLLNRSPLPKQKRQHSFQVEPDLLLHIVMDSSEHFVNHSSSDSEEKRTFSKNVIDLPLKEHLLASKRLKLATQNSSGVPSENAHQVSLVSDEAPLESAEPPPLDWVIQRKEERQFQIDRFT